MPEPLEPLIKQLSRLSIDELEKVISAAQQMVAARRNEGPRA